MQYYGAFYRSALLPLLGRINAYLMRWLARNTNGSHPRRRPGLLGTRHRSVPPAVRPLGLGALFLVVRMTGAV